VDPEDEFYPEEIAKVESDVRSMGLNLLVFGEWFNLETMKQASVNAKCETYSSLLTLFTLNHASSPGPLL
jgi:hypothetical protein